MLKSCKYCGRVHDSKFDCGKKPKIVYNSKINTKQNSFRNTKRWQRKRQEIKERDHYLCQVCLDKNILENNNLSVHHIVPIVENYDLRLENNNLITLCDIHHKQAENGEIPREFLQKLI